MQTIDRKQSHASSRGASLAGAAFLAALAFAAPAGFRSLWQRRRLHGGETRVWRHRRVSTRRREPRLAAQRGRGVRGDGDIEPLDWRRFGASAGRRSHGRHHRQWREAERLDNFEPHRKHAHHHAHRSRRQHDKASPAARRIAGAAATSSTPGSASKRLGAAGREAASLRRMRFSRADGDRRRDQLLRLHGRFDPIAKSSVPHERELIDVDQPRSWRGLGLMTAHFRGLLRPWIGDTWTRNGRMQREIIRVEPIDSNFEKWGAPVSTCTRAGKMVFVSGMPPFDPETGEILVHAPFERQVELILEQMKKALGGRRVGPRPCAEVQRAVHLGGPVQGLQRSLQALLPEKSASPHLLLRA